VRIPSSSYLPRIYLLSLLFFVFLVGPVPDLFLAIVLLLLQVASLYRPPPPHIELTLTVVTLFLVSAGLASIAGWLIALLVLLPAIPTLEGQILRLASHRRPGPFREGLSLTTILRSSVWTLGGMVTLGILSGNPSILGTSFFLVTALAIRGVYEFRVFRQLPLNIESKSLRLLVNSHGYGALNMRNKAPFHLTVNAGSHEKWLTLPPSSLKVQVGQEAQVDFEVKPPYSGKNEPVVQITVTGPWGLLSLGFTVKPLVLHVIPKARHAAWLARRYLETSREGHNSLTTGSLASQASRSRGVEYQRIREYAPGDSLRDISWRATYKFGKMMTKERLDPVSGTVVLLVNIVAGNHDQADWLSYQLVMSALSAARQEQSLLLLAYDRHEPVQVTGPMKARDGVKMALQLSSQVTTASGPERRLAPPDFAGLRRTIRGLDQSMTPEAENPLGRLLKIELENLDSLANLHPVTTLVRNLLHRGVKGAAVTVISSWNHDAEALAKAVPQLRSQGYRTVDLLSETI
jgi:uncharacterized protein (DUF58 family)